MFSALKFRLNRRKVFNRLNEFYDIELYKYQTECRMADGSIVHIGDFYKYTNRRFDSWVSLLLNDDSLRTNNDTYIKSKNIIECKMVSMDTISVKFAYEDSWDLNWKTYFGDDEIEKCRKEYDELICLSNIK